MACSAESAEAGSRASRALVAIGSAAALVLRKVRRLNIGFPLFCGGRGSVIASGDHALASLVSA